MTRLLLALALALILPSMASAEARPGDAPRGSPAETRRSSTPPAMTQDKAPGGGRSGGPSTARPAPTPRQQQQDGDAPMTFVLVREGPADACRDACRTWVSAAGRITPDTARDFQAFARQHDLRGLVVALNSNGGTVTSGLDLGRAFRGLEMTTTVGKTTILPGGTDAEPRATLSPRANCASMCAFALLGGARRHVPPEARVLVHQIWPSSKRDDAAAQTYTADNLVSLQRSLGMLAHFIVDMGVDVELFEMSMRIPPWERMRALSADELRRLRVRTADNPFDPPLTANGPASLPPLSEVAPAATPVGGAWSLIERGGLRILSRSHPLTIEGDDIGSFEIVVTCGESPSSYSLSYREKRHPSDAADRLAKVMVMSGKDRLALAVQSSARSDADLESVARGTISSALLGTFADTGDRSIVVATETANNVRTLIRLGNTGMRSALPQLAAICRR